MDIRSQLLSELSRRNIDFTIHTLGNNKEYFRELMTIILKEKDPLPMRASWAAEGITAKYPELIEPYINDLVKHLKQFTHTGTIRNVLKMLTRVKLEEKYHGRMVDTCFNWLSGDDMPVAVKVHSMQILANLIPLYPELKNEFLDILNEQVPRNSPGFVARVRKIKKDLGRI